MLLRVFRLVTVFGSEFRKCKLDVIFVGLAREPQTKDFLLSILPRCIHGMFLPATVLSRPTRIYRAEPMEPGTGGGNLGLRLEDAGAFLTPAP